MVAEEIDHRCHNFFFFLFIHGGFPAKKLSEDTSITFIDKVLLEVDGRPIDCNVCDAEFLHFVDLLFEGGGKDLEVVGIEIGYHMVLHGFAVPLGEIEKVSDEFVGKEENEDEQRNCIDDLNDFSDFSWYHQ